MSTIARFNPVMIAAVIAPTICVFAVSFLGKGARSVSAAEERFQPAAIEPVPFRIDRLKETPAAERAIPSPFYFEVYESPVHVEAIPDDIDRAPTADDLPPVRVTSILPSGRTPMAIIDGRPRKIGDTLESGWKVLSINGSDFTVTLVHPSGYKIRAGIKNNP